MTLFETLYIFAGLVALSAGIPQLKQLLLTRRSDEFSLQTWGIWTATQVMTLAYVASLGNVIMTIMNIAWVTFYLVMTLLIYKYRHVAPAAVAVEEPTEV